MTAMNENRAVEREEIVGVTVFVRRPDGTVSEGVVRDASDGGVRISGDAVGLNTGDEVELTLVVLGQKVRYRGEVRHVETMSNHFGVRYRSGPERVNETEGTRRCMQCRRDFPMDCTYCSHCGQKLMTR